MSGPLKCSVIIPTYNRATLLRYTLESLTRQSLPTDQFEVLVGDDGSSDDTAAMVESFGSRLNVHYFFQEDEGYRSAQARNVGLAHAAGDISVFFDAGVLAHSHCLAEHVSSHEQSSGPVAVCGYVYGFNVDNQDADAIRKAIDTTDTDGSIDRMTGNPAWADVREEFYDIYTEEIGELPAPWIIFWTCNASAPTALARSVGGLDEAIQGWGAEDLDLGYRLFNAGARFIVNRRASSIHYPHPKSFVANNKAAMVNYRYMAEKYGTPIIKLLTEFPEEATDDFTGFVTPFNINNVIRERGLPTCAEYLAGRAANGDAHD
jgi:glycosyltransferase involved in cell wall biosynthesis